MRTRVALTSLAALAWAEAAAAQPAAAIADIPAEARAVDGRGFAPAPGAARADPVLTDIVPDVGDLDLRTQVTQSGSVTTIDGGTLAGRNLFHSFSRFDLGQGDVARWIHSAGDPAAIRNVVNRVTGGDPSLIFGMLDSTGLPNADFFFINPAGIVFGAGAQVNVPAAAHFSTASELRFGEGPSFTVATPGGSTFSVANPAAFGFVGGQGSIVAEGLRASLDGNLHLSGADLSISGSALSAGGLSLFAVGGGQSVVTLDNLPDVQPGGQLVIADSLLRATGRESAGGGILGVGDSIFVTGSAITSGYAGPALDASGAVVFSGGRIDLVDSLLASQPGTSGDSGPLALLASDRIGMTGSFVRAAAGDGSSGDVGIISIAAPSLEMNASSVSTETDGAGDAGAVTIKALDIVLDRGSVISSTALAGSTGNAGLIAIARPLETGGSLLVAGGSAIRSDTFGTGDAGGVVIQTGEIVLRTGGQITTDSDPFCAASVCGRSGAPGAILITADRLTLSSPDPLGPFSRISSDNGGARDGGGILLTVGELLLEGYSSISSDALSSGTGGSIEVNANRVVLRGNPDDPFGRPAPSISTSTFGTGAGGALTINASELVSLENGAGINSDTGDQRGDRAQEGGPAGTISITAPLISLSRGSGITSISRTTGDAGLIELAATQVIVDDFSFIESVALGAGDAGLIAIGSHSLAVTNTSFIDSSTLGSGSAGNVLIDLAGDLVLANNSSIRTEAEPGSTGSAGLIAIAAGGTVAVVNGSAISSNLSSLGEAGLVAISADEIIVAAGGTISTDAHRICAECTASGAGGDLLLEARRILVSGAGAEEGATFISSDTFGTGSAGSVTVIASETMEVSDGAFISSDTYGAGDAGEVAVRVGQSLLIDGGGIQSAAQPDSTGNAGFLTVVAPDLIIRNGGYVTTATGGAGNAGDLQVGADRILLESEGSINSGAFPGSTGDAGLVDVRVGELILRGGAEIVSDTAGSGDAGLVRIRATSIDVEDAAISSRARCMEDSCADLGAAGSVDIETGRIGVRTTGAGRQSAVSTNTDGGNPAGDVFIRSDLIEVAGSGARIQSATSGAGGAGTVTLRGGRLTVVNGGAVATRANEFSTGDAGAIDIDLASVRVEGGSITSASVGSGAAGTVRVRADSVTVDHGGMITSNAGAAASAAGTVAIDAREVLVDRGAAIFTDTAGAGAAGQVAINARENLRVDRRGTISSNTSGAGAGGAVLIRAGSVELAGEAEIASRTEAAATGNAGSVRIEADRLTVREASRISSETAAAGNAGSVAIAVRDVTVTNGGNISSSTTSSGNAGTVQIMDAASLRIDGGARVSSTSTGTGAAGNIEVGARAIVMDGGGVIESNAAPDAAAAGRILIAADTLTMRDRAAISTSSLGRGPAGQIGVLVGELAMTGGARIASNTGGACREACVQSGDAGEVLIVATRDVTLRSGSEISSNSNSGSGNAGQVGIAAPRLLLAGGRISTGTSAASTGRSGRIGLAVDELVIDGEGSIETISRNTNPAGRIEIEADSVLLRGERSRIASSNESRAGGDAGAVLIDAGTMSLFDGAQINTSSAAGAAGDIRITMPANAFLTLDSRGLASRINTSSGPGTGGRILIAGPFAIISNGGEILALGQSGGANVEIVTQYFISSSDRFNQVAVDGNFLLEAAAYDVSAGTVNRDLSVIDASGVLRGQCAAARATGQVSQLVVRPIGPYGSRPTSARPNPSTRLLTARQLAEHCS